ncbi:MAG: DNA-binding protein [Lachnospiraceae bacterium]|nr:DNA-binding protein [Lachnospiraceae bacterium]
MNKLLMDSLLYDFYGDMLSEHQKGIYEDFVLNDLSLSEIAEEHGISRQGVHDTVKRCSEKLADYEAKLKLVDKFMKIRKDISEIEKQAGMLKSGETEAGEAADRIAFLAGQILEEI